MPKFSHLKTVCQKLLSFLRSVFLQIDTFCCTANKHRRQSTEHFGSHASMSNWDGVFCVLAFEKWRFRHFKPRGYLTWGSKYTD